MVLIKREDVTKQGFCKIPSSGKSVISTYLMFFGLEGPERGWGGVGPYLSLSLRGKEAG